MKKTPSLKKTTSFRLVRNPLLLVIAVFTVLGSMPLQAMRAAAARRPHYWANWQKLGGAALGLGALDLAARGKKSLAYRGGHNLKKFAHWLRHGSEKGRLHDMKAHFGRNKKKYLAAVVIALIAEIARRRFGDCLRARGPHVGDLDVSAAIADGAKSRREGEEVPALPVAPESGEGSEGQPLSVDSPEAVTNAAGVVGHLDNLEGFVAAEAEAEEAEEEEAEEEEAEEEEEVPALPAAPAIGQGSEGQPLSVDDPEAVINAQKGSWVFVMSAKYRTHARDLEDKDPHRTESVALNPVVTNEAGVVGHLDKFGLFVAGLVKEEEEKVPVEIGNVSEIAGLLQEKTLIEDGFSRFTLAGITYYLEDPSNLSTTFPSNSYYVFCMKPGRYGFLDKTSGQFTPPKTLTPVGTVTPEIYNCREYATFTLDNVTYTRDKKDYDTGDVCGNVVSIAVLKDDIPGDIIAGTGSFEKYSTD